MLVMAGLGIAPQLRPHFQSNLVEIDPTNPDQTEIKIVQHLKAMNAQKNAQIALLALVTLALGLLIFAPVE